MLASFGRSWHSHIPLGLLFNFQGTVRRSFTYSHRERSNAPPKREKYLRIKNSLHSFGQRVPKCTPISELFLENFLRKKFTLHLFGITKPNDTLFHRKNEKIFFRLQVLYSACQKSPFTYSHWERPNAPPNLKKIYPFTYLELRSRNATCFREKFLKKNLELELNEKSRYYPNKMGVNFCGYRIWPTHRLLRTNSTV